MRDSSSPNYYNSGGSRDRQWRSLYSPAFAISALLVLVFALGGGARPDLASAPYLRALAALALGLSLLTLTKTAIADNRHLIGFALGCLALPLVQLLPLPSGLANSLRGHELVQQIDSQLGMSGLWRPLTLSPDWTLNSALALLAPIAVLLFAIQLRKREQEQVAIVLLLIGGTSVLFALLQILGPANGPLYFYEITNNGAAVGVFANRNHQAVFLACLLPVFWAFVANRQPREVKPTPAIRDQRGLAKFGKLARGPMPSILAAVVIFVPMILVTGSRSGLLAAAIAILSMPFVLGWQVGPGGAQNRHNRPWATLLALAAIVTALTSLAIWLGRSEAVDRLLASTPSDEMRLKIIPVMREMIGTYWPWGSGMGTFQKVYQVFEPEALLAPTYMNHAHNDWLELVMTGGLAGSLLLGAVCFAWLVCSYRVIAARNCDLFQPYRRAGLTILLLLGLASVTDYPLRTPSLAALFVVALVWLTRPLPRPPELI